MKSRREKRAGFSLVEVVVALAIFAFCAFILFGLVGLGQTFGHTSSSQTTMANLLNAVASDIRSTPNTSPRGGASQSLIYGINLPSANGTASVTPQQIYIDASGQATPTAAGASYQLNVWTFPSTGQREETTLRLLLTWPAAAPSASPQGSIETVVAVNRD